LYNGISYEVAQGAIIINGKSTHNVWGIHCRELADIQGTTRGKLDIQGTFRDLLGNIQGRFGEHTMNIKGTFGEHSGRPRNPPN
jgi:hypothetical protein